MANHHLFLDDLPVTLCERADPTCRICRGRRSGVADLFGQKLIVDQLAGILRRGSRRRSMTIALHGRFGQGKTSILRGLECRLRRDGVRYDKIDTAAFRPDEMLYDFEAMISHWYFSIKLGAFLFAGLVLTIFYYLYALESRIAWNPTAFVGAMAAYSDVRQLASLVNAASLPVVLLATIWLGGFLARKSVYLFRLDILGRTLGSRLTVAEWGGALYNLVRLSPPEVLIIDNLDRATVDQQKALLRALRRHRDRLKCAVVVAFDQTAIVASAPDPEAPQELLAKLFNLAVQLPPLTPADAGHLALYLSAQAPLIDWPLAGTPMALGDIARILLLLRRHSVRFAKVFFNNVKVVSDSMRLADASDLAAVMRLHGLFVLVPALRHDTVGLADILRGNQADRLIQHIEDELGLPVTADQKRALRHFMRMTCHMHPSLGAWHRFLGAYGSALGRVGTNDHRPSNSSGPAPWPSTPFDPAHARSWLGWDLAFAARADEPDARLRHYRRCAAWPLIQCQDSAAEGLQGDGREIVADRTPEDHMVWLYVLHRLWLADAEVIDLMPAAERTALLLLDWQPTTPPHPALSEDVRRVIAEQAGRDEVATAFMRLLPTAPAGAHHLINAALLTASSLMGLRPKGDAAPAWLRSAAMRSRPDVVVRRVLLGRYIDANQIGALEEGWPHLPKPANPVDIDWAEAEAHVRGWTEVRRQGTNVPAGTIGQFLAHVAVIDDGSATIVDGVRRLVAAACPEFEPGGVGVWDASLIVAIWDAAKVAGGKSFFRHAVRCLDVLGARTSPNWPIFFAATILGRERGIRQVRHWLRHATGWDRGFWEALLDVSAPLPIRLSSIIKAELRISLRSLLGELNASADAYDLSLADQLEAWLA